MASVRIELNREGVRQAALTSPEIRAHLRERAERVAAQAESNTDLVIEVAEGGTKRARVYVRMLGAQAARTEAKHRILGSAMDAAGD